MPLELVTVAFLSLRVFSVTLLHVHVYKYLLNLKPAADLINIQQV